MSKIEQLGLDWAARSLDGDQWVQFLEDEVRQHQESAAEWEQHRSRWQRQDAPARDTSNFADPSDNNARTLTRVDSLHERLRAVLTPPLLKPLAELGFLQGVEAANQMATTPVSAFRQGVEASQELMKAAVEPDAPAAYVPSPEEEQLRHQFVELKLPPEPDALPQKATAEAHAALRGEGASATTVTADPVPGDSLKTIAGQPDLVRKPAVELDLPTDFIPAQLSKHEYIVNLIEATRVPVSGLREAAEAGLRSAQPVPDFKQAMSAIVEAVRVVCGVDVKEGMKAAVELEATSDFLPAKKSSDGAAQAAMREPGTQAITEPQEAVSELKTLAPKQPEPLLKPAVQPDDGAVIQATEATAPRTPVVMTRETVTLVREQPATAAAPAPDVGPRGMTRETVTLVREQPATASPAPTPAPAPEAGPRVMTRETVTLVREQPPAPPAPAPVAAPTPVAAPAPAPAAAAAPAPAAVPTGPTPEQNAKMREVWQSSAAADPFQVLRTMDDFGMSVAQAAQAAGVSEFELSCLLVRLGVPKGYAGLSFSREEVNGDFEAQMQAAIQSGQFRKLYVEERGEGGATNTVGGFDMKAFVQHYLAQNTEASRRFAAVHGQSQVEDGDSFSQSATFGGTGYRVQVVGGGSVDKQWAVNDKAVAIGSTPKASAQERAEIKANLEENYGDVLAAYGGGETLPDNAVTASLRAKYGEALATLMYQLDKAMERARNEYIGGLQAAVAGTNRQGWVTHTQVVRDESGEAHEVKTQTFDVKVFHAELMQRTDPKAQVLKKLFGTLEGSEGDFVIKGAGGVQHFSLSYSESGQPSLHMGQLETPEGTRKIDLANPPKLKDATAVGYIPGVGFVTEISNIIPPKKKKNKWKMALTIVACVAISFATAGAGTAAAGAMGLTGTAASVTAAAITGAVTAAATTAASGLIMTGKIDGKAVLKGALTGAISAAVTPFVGGGVVQQMAVQGTISKLSGGKFATGALSAAAAGLSGWVDTNVANALKGTALGGVAGAIGKAAGSITKAGVSSGGHGGEQFWNSIANDIGSAIVTPHLEAWAKDNQKTQPDRQQPAGGQNRPDQSGSPGQSSAPSPAPQVDPLEQASPPADLYGDTDQWASDNQQALEDDQRAQQRAQEEARSNAQSSFRQSELEAQQRPLRLTPPDLQDLDMTPINGSDLASDQAHDRAGDVPVRTETRLLVGQNDALEKLAKAQYGNNWRAGMVAMVQENKLRFDANGSPIIRQGQTLVAPDLSTMSEAGLARANRAGGQMIESNTSGLERAQQERAQRSTAIAGGARGGQEVGVTRPSSDGWNDGSRIDMGAWHPSSPVATPASAPERGLWSGIGEGVDKARAAYSGLQDQIDGLGKAVTQKVNEAEKSLDDLRKNLVASGERNGVVTGALARTASDHVGMWEGATKAAYDAAAGMSKLAQGFLNIATPMGLLDPQRTAQAQQGVVNFVEQVGPIVSLGSWVTDPSGTADKLGNLGKAVAHPYMEAIEQGDYAKAAGRLAFDLGSMLVGGEASVSGRMGLSRSGGATEALGGAAKVAEESAALRRIAENPVGPVLEGKPAGSILEMQTTRRLVAEESAALGRVAESPVGPVLEGKSSGSILEQQNTRRVMSEEFGNAGKPVELGITLGADEVTVNTAANLKPLDGYYDVVIHGNLNGVAALENGAWRHYSVDELAELVLAQPDYSGGPLRLASCRVGQLDGGFAQLLANRIGQEVLAPTDKLFVWPNGRIVIGPHGFRNTGGWRSFKPKNSGD